jgi:hypothetical protein
VTDDWLDFLAAMRAANARFLVVGAHALAVHGIPRATQDLDVWIERSSANADAVASALTAFGAPLAALEIGRAELTQEDQVIQIGVAPNRIDVLTSLSGLPDFEIAWSNRIEQRIGSTDVPFLGKADLIATKRATGRTKDLADLEQLSR